MGIERIGIKLTDNLVNLSGRIIRNEQKVGFSRLKSVFGSAQNYHCYDEIVFNAKNKTIGNIPKELLGIIIRKYPNNKGQNIKSLQNAFGNIAKTLKEVETSEITTIKNMTNKDDEIKFLIKELFPSTNISSISSSSNEVISRANKNFTEELNKLLGSKHNTSLEFLGNGQYGNAYKIQITNEAGEKIMHDRVIKVFKDDNLSVELASLQRHKIKELLPKYSDEEIYEIYKTIPRKATGMKIKVSEEQLKRNFSNTMQSHRYTYDVMNLEGCEKDFMQQIREARDIHGLYAEANSTYRLKKILGHDISKTDAVNTDMFDLDLGYSISQYSDNLLPKIKSKINFSLLGLDYGDVKTANYVGGRLVDFGGMTTISKQFEDKTVLKYYKKIMNRVNIEERNELIQQYLTMIQNPKTPHREKIIEAMRLAKYPVPFI